ncbi:uncharacterized protein G2W53_032324 [Senna tora]|uniref:Uncharacterized protein n=1 Tax=Senna tora TaxID=362788 RepID=A0A834SXE6_9FABA|nr:uncharacterized protein G2W53_032324 [Senna tora]
MTTAATDDNDSGGSEVGRDDYAASSFA